MADHVNLVVSSDKNFEADVLKAHGALVVDFWAPWCGPCQMFAPIFEKVAAEYEGKAKFVKMNVDDNPTTANQFQVMSIPTLAMFRDGQMVERTTGYLDEAGLKKQVDEWLSK